MFFFNLSAFYFFYFASIAVFIIFFPKVLFDKGYSTADIGILFAIPPLIRFLIPFFFLKFIDLTKKVYLYALFFTLVGVLTLYATIDQFSLLLFSMIIIGVSHSLLLPYVEIIAIDKLGKDRYGKSRLYGSIGFMVIALILGEFLKDEFTLINYYLFTVIMIAIFGIYMINYETKKDQDTKEDTEKFSLLKYWPFWLSIFLMQVGFGGFYNFFTIYETSHGISLEMTSILWSFGVLCEVVMLYYQGPILKLNLLSVIKFSIFITVIRWLLLFLFPDSLEITFLAQSIHAFSFGLYHSSVIIFLYSLYENKKLAQQFMLGFAYGLGGFLGALIAGLVYGEYLFLFSSLFALLSFISLSFFKKKV
jgi:PPP family 3-phenylpropionic acid transporter